MEDMVVDFNETAEGTKIIIVEDGDLVARNQILPDADAEVVEEFVRTTPMLDMGRKTEDRARRKG